MKTKTNTKMKAKHRQRYCYGQCECSYSCCCFVRRSRIVWYVVLGNQIAIEMYLTAFEWTGEMHKKIYRVPVRHLPNFRFNFYWWIFLYSGRISIFSSCSLLAEIPLFFLSLENNKVKNRIQTRWCLLIIFYINFILFIKRTQIGYYFAFLCGEWFFFCVNQIVDVHCLSRFGRHVAVFTAFFDSCFIFASFIWLWNFVSFMFNEKISLARIEYDIVNKQHCIYLIR